MNSSLNCLHLLGFSPISNLKSRTDLEIPLLYELSGIQSVPPSCGEISWILYTHSLLPQSESYLKLFPAFFITTCVLTHHSLMATALWLAVEGFPVLYIHIISQMHVFSDAGISTWSQSFPHSLLAQYFPVCVLWFTVSFHVLINVFL